jgi:hypothetical protein
VQQGLGQCCIFVITVSLVYHQALDHSATQKGINDVLDISYNAQSAASSSSLSASSAIKPWITLQITLDHPADKDLAQQPL